MGSSLGKIPEFDESLKGKYCVLTYDGLPYPGIINYVDDGEIEVMVMHRVGDNRYFWPLRDDCLWYSRENFVTVIPVPNLVAKRHHEIEKQIYNIIKDKLNMWDWLKNEMCNSHFHFELLH